MDTELLTPAEMGEADRLTIAKGDFDGRALMARAGAAVADCVGARFPGASAVHVLAGPGNNGGDGYVAARLLAEAGRPVTVWAEGAPRPESDAAWAAKACPVAVFPLADFRCEAGSVVIDALFGAGLSKPIGGAAAAAIDKVSGSGAAIVAVDLPSGVSGDSGRIIGGAARAAATVTFFRKKPGHLLYPGRDYCGETIIADIGIGPDVLAAIAPKTFENRPPMWARLMPWPDIAAHKYARGHVCVFSGGASATGAARMAAQAALRIGAGAVTVLSPAAAMPANAAHLTAIMLRRIDSADELAAFVDERRPSACALGPGFGVGEAARTFALAILCRSGGPLHGLVLDADAITSFSGDPHALFGAAGRSGAPALVLTPHEGEFRRLFPDLAGEGSPSKLGAARSAAARANAVIVYKGPDTVIAAPDGRAAINGNASPFLATAGSGDVLAGMIAGLMAQGMPAFEAAAAAVWMHAEAGRRFGPGLIAEDLPDLLPPALRQLLIGSGG